MKKYGNGRDDFVESLRFRLAFRVPFEELSDLYFVRLAVQLLSRERAISKESRKRVLALVVVEVVGQSLNFC